MPEANSDRALVQLVLKQKPGAFEELIHRYQRLVQHMVYRLIDNQLDRQDVCQDVFIKVYQALPSFRFDCKLSTWIGKVAYRTALNALEKKRAVLFEDHSAGLQIDELPGAQRDPHWNMEQADRRKHLESSIGQLDDKFRTALTLYHLEGMSYLEIGEIMDLPEGTVKSHIFRARKQLKTILQENYAGEML